MKIFKKWVLLLVVGLIILMGVSCGQEINTTGNMSNTSTKNDYSILQAKPLKNKEITIVSHYSLWGEKDDGTFVGYKAIFNSQYGGIVNEVLCSYNDYMTRVASMVLADQAPDGVVRTDVDSIPFMTFVTKGLCQPFDDYIDLNEPIYSRLKVDIEYSKWLGKTYFLVHNNDCTSMTYYNKKLFEDAGLEEPYSLFKKGEWTWDSMLSAAKQLTVINSATNEADVSGIYIEGPEILVATTGKTIGTITNGNDVKMDLTVPGISKAMQFLFDLNAIHKVKYSQPSGWAIALQKNKLAMAIAGIYHRGDAEIKEMIKAGEIYFAPLPKDPNADKSYSQKAEIGWILCQGAKNPEGLVAFNKSMIYANYYDVEEKAAKDATRMKNLGVGMDFINLEYEMMYQPNGISDFGKGFSQEELWKFLDQTEPWSTYVAKVTNPVEVKKNEAIVPPQG